MERGGSLAPLSEAEGARRLALTAESPSDTAGLIFFCRVRHYSQQLLRTLISLKDVRWQLVLLLSAVSTALVQTTAALLVMSLVSFIVLAARHARQLRAQVVATTKLCIIEILGDAGVQEALGACLAAVFACVCADPTAQARLDECRVALPVWLVDLLWHVKEEPSFQKLVACAEKNTVALVHDVLRDDLVQNAVQTCVTESMTAEASQMCLKTSVVDALVVATLNEEFQEGIVSVVIDVAGELVMKGASKVLPQCLGAAGLLSKKERERSVDLRRELRQRVGAPAIPSPSLIADDSELKRSFKAAKEARWRNPTYLEGVSVAQRRASHRRRLLHTKGCSEEHALSKNLSCEACSPRGTSERSLSREAYRRVQSTSARRLAEPPGW